MWNDLRALFWEPRPDRPLAPSRVDGWLVLVFVPATLLEGTLAHGVPLRPLHLAVGIVIACTLWFRRTRPLLATATSFGLAIATTIANTVLGHPPASLATSASILFLPYSLFRWGSGREIATGLALIVLTYVTALFAGEMHGAEELIGSAVVLLFPCALGASVRYRAEVHRRDVAHAKLFERAEIARDLHDTVAHHVSAIAIQAQAGRAVLARQPEAAGRALEAIEQEASRTLAELRGMVHTLRDSREPVAGVADIARLAERMGAVLPIDVEIDAGLEQLLPAVQSALYRIAQESITNAIRHARGAKRVQVRVVFESGVVRLTVTDDGAVASRRPMGMGLVGMAERAALLGGKLEAGPRDGGGWTVEATIVPGGGARK